MENVQDIIADQAQQDSLNASFSKEMQADKSSAVNNNQFSEHYPEDNLDTRPGTSKQCRGIINSPQTTETSTEYEKPSDEEPSTGISSVQSGESYVCRICHNNESPERLVSPCLCKGTLAYVHIHCLERWISTSRYTSCELCQYEYNTHQVLRYTMFESLRIWYSRPLSRRSLQEDCQMCSLLTLVALSIIATILVAVQYYVVQGRVTGVGRAWTKGWLFFFLTVTMCVYVLNVYMIAKSQFAPWYRWWRSAREIHLLLENHRPFRFDNDTKRQHQSALEEQQQQKQVTAQEQQEKKKEQQQVKLQKQQEQQQAVVKIVENNVQNIEPSMERKIQETAAIELPLNINQESIAFNQTPKDDYIDNGISKQQITTMTACVITSKQLPDLTN